MPIYHKFLNYNLWENGFYTEDSILKSSAYKPEAIIIGTFNHGWPWNDADFFYGRGMYMWTIMANLFLHGHNHLTRRRTAQWNSPTLPEIFTICIKGKLCFADVVRGTKPNIPTVEHDRFILVNGDYPWKDYRDVHLDHMGASGWLDDNVKTIADYINATPSIRNIYFTYKSGVWIVDKMNEIINACPNVSACSIFSPTGNGFGRNLAHPVDRRAWSLNHCWIWNGLAHAIPVNKRGYGHLDHTWLIGKDVDVNNF